MFPEALCGPDGCSQLVEDCETGFPAKTGRGTKEGNQKLQSDSAHKCHVEVVRVLCDDKRLNMGEVNKISCQHLQVLVTSLFQGHWEFGAPNNVFGKHGHQDSFRRSEAEACCKHFGKPRPTRAAILFEPSGIDGVAMFECVENSFTLNGCLRQGSVEAHRGKWWLRNS